LRPKIEPSFYDSRSAERGDPLTTGKATILLVENEDAFDATAKALREAGLSVVHATTAIDAFSVLESPRAIDLLLTALSVPGQPSGFTIARMGQRKRPNLAVAYLAHSAEVPEAELARALGPVLRRPAPGTLATEILAALGRGTKEAG
jgi:CheY-like chemotaxis protein